MLMIEDTIVATVNPLYDSINDLTARVKSCERSQRDTSEVSTLKVEVEDMRNDVSYPTSTEFTLLLEAANDLDVQRLQRFL